MAITAAQVKELRERTGAGMMECKKALTECDGDMEAAVDALRKAGAAKADKKAGRVAAEGVVAVRQSDDGKIVAMVEVNAETDFVAKRDEFTGYADDIAGLIIDNNPDDLAALMALSMGGDASVEEKRKELIAQIGENISVRRFARMESSGNVFGVYRHGVRIGVVVELEGGDEELARDIAMHIAASRPVCINESDIPQELLDKEKEIFSAQAKESGKPDDIIEKMVTGRMKKYVNEVTLLGQPFVKDPDTTVGKLVSSKGATVASFERMEVGEGIEKKVDDFAEEVMAQVKGS
jgi:elongation factor Ts